MKRFLSIIIVAGLGLAICSCDALRTEMLLVIDNGGVEIPREIDGIALEAKDSNGQTVFQMPQPIRLCRAGEDPNGSPKCYAFPIVVKLIPGERAPTDQVRLDINAVRGQARVLANTAVFYFAKGRTLRLDVVLYPDCLGYFSCAQQNKLCVQNKVCESAMPSEVDPGTTDLAKRPPPDLSPDLAAPADLRECNPSGMCEDCGALGQQCCGGVSCATTGLRCEAGTCVEVCGRRGELCCSTGNQCEDPLVCDNGAPARCNDPPMDMGSDMTPCGGPGEDCCPGDICTTPGYVCNPHNICEFGPIDMGGGEMTCGYDYRPCCPLVSGPQCYSQGFSCQGGTCYPSLMLGDMGMNPPPPPPR